MNSPYSHLMGKNGEDQIPQRYWKKIKALNSQPQTLSTMIPTCRCLGVPLAQAAQSLNP